MPTYQEMYYKSIRATEKAINILIEMQQECEDLIISQKEPEPKIISPDLKNDTGIEENK